MHRQSSELEVLVLSWTRPSSHPFHIFCVHSLTALMQKVLHISTNQDMALGKHSQQLHQPCVSATGISQSCQQRIQAPQSTAYYSFSWIKDRPALLFQDIYTERTQLGICKQPLVHKRLDHIRMDSSRNRESFHWHSYGIDIIRFEPLTPLSRRILLGSKAGCLASVHQPSLGIEG
jgi:hypothetical protein